MKTFLILHGWGSCAKNWGKVKELLENQRHKVFIPDLPGFGECKTFTSPSCSLRDEFGQNPSPATQTNEVSAASQGNVLHFPSKPWSIDDYVNWVENYINDLQINGEFVEPFYLLGHSFGGSIATKFTIRHSEKIQKLFLVGCAGIRKKTFKKKIAKKIAKIFNFFSFLPFYPFFRKVLYKLILRSDYLAVKNSIMKETYQNVINEDISKKFSKISVSTILIWGKKDKLTPLKDAYYIKNAISGAKLEVLPGIFHNPHLENPKLLVDKILTYI